VHKARLLIYTFTYVKFKMNPWGNQNSCWEYCLIGSLEEIWGDEMCYVLELGGSYTDVENSMKCIF
jgi:hypothetical protein